MALTYGFFNSLNGDRKYNAKQFGAIFDGVITDGVYSSVGGRMVVQASGSGFQVNIQPGRAWFDHTWTLNDAVYAIQLPSPEPLFSKWVAVVLEVNEEQGHRRNSFVCVEGTPGSNEYPVLTNTTLVHQHPLAYCKVRAGASEITQSDIVNMVGTSSCPYVTGVVSSFNIDELIAQWRSQWNDEMNNERDRWGMQMQAQNAEFGTFMNSANSELSSTISGYDSTFNSKISGYDSTFNSKVSGYDTTFNQNQQTQSATFNQAMTGYDTTFNADKDAMDSWFTTFSDQADTWFTNSEDSFDTFMTQSRNSFNQQVINVTMRADELINRFDNQFTECKDDFDAAMADMVSEFDSFWDDFKAGMVEYLTAQETIWENWFQRIQGQLSEDAATNLQRQIDALCYVYILDSRAILGIACSVLHNKAVFGTYGSVSGSKLMITAPSH